VITREEDLRGGGARLRLAVERVPHAARRHGEGPRRCRGQRAREPRDVGGGPVPHRRSGRLGDQDAEVSRRGHLGLQEHHGAEHVARTLDEVRGEAEQQLVDGGVQYTALSLMA